MKKKRKKRYQFKKKFIKMIERRTVREVMHFYQKEANDMVLDLPPLTETDKLFVLSDNVNDPCLNRNRQIREHQMTEGYFFNAIHLLEIIEIAKSNAIRDGYIYPALFSFRHCLELIMKDTLNIRADKGIVSELVTKKIHNLYEIWCKFKEHVSYDNEKDIMEQLMRELSDMDPMSFNFRYPYDVKGNTIKLLLTDEKSFDIVEASLDSEDKFLLPFLIDVEKLKNTMLKMYRYLEGVNEEVYNS